MAWNPTPEVQVARDAAKALTKAGRFIDRIVCDDCGCPSPEPETLHEATGIRICNACEAKATEKAREYVRDS